EIGGHAKEAKAITQSGAIGGALPPPLAALGRRGRLLPRHSGIPPLRRRTPPLPAPTLPQAGGAKPAGTRPRSPPQRERGVAELGVSGRIREKALRYRAMPGSRARARITVASREDMAWSFSWWKRSR